MARAHRPWETQIEVGDCWEWIGALRDGYGRIYLNGGAEAAHRHVWEALVGPVPDGLELDHLCRNKRCVNPDHLEPVTHAENMRRSIPGNSKKTHCPHGHEYTPENTYRPPGSPTNRMCRACAKGKLGGSGYRRKRRAAAT